jgi:hypothetical protein
MVSTSPALRGVDAVVTTAGGGHRFLSVPCVTVTDVAGNIRRTTTGFDLPDRIAENTLEG